MTSGNDANTNVLAAAGRQEPGLIYNFIFNFSRNLTSLSMIRSYIIK